MACSSAKQKNGRFNDKQWNVMFEALVSFHAEHGHWIVPDDVMVHGLSLNRWRNTQSHQYNNKMKNKKNALTDDRMQKLMSVNFPFSDPDASHIAWNSMYDALAEFYSVHGHPNCPKDLTHNGKKLSVWSDTNRTNFRKGNLTDDQIDKLRKIKCVAFEQKSPPSVSTQAFPHYQSGVSDVPDQDTIGEGDLSCVVEGIHTDNDREKRRRLSMGTLSSFRCQQPETKNIHNAAEALLLLPYGDTGSAAQRARQVSSEISKPIQEMTQQSTLPNCQLNETANYSSVIDLQMDSSHDEDSFNLPEPELPDVGVAVGKHDNVCNAGDSVSLSKNQRTDQHRKKPFERNIAGSVACTEGVRVKPLLPPPPPPEIPNELAYVWSYEESTRILLGNFNKLDKSQPIAECHKCFLFRMMQRDDITVVSEGLLEFGVDNVEHWLLQRLKEQMGEKRVYSKFRRFNRNRHTHTYDEVEGTLSMEIGDFIKYIQKRTKAIAEEVTNHAGSKAKKYESSFVFTDSAKRHHKIKNVLDTALYMIDVEMENQLPQTARTFETNFRLKDILPGGQMCMMKWVSQY